MSCLELECHNVVSSRLEHARGLPGSNPSWIWQSVDLQLAKSISLQDSACVASVFYRAVTVPNTGDPVLLCKKSAQDPGVSIAGAVRSLHSHQESRPAKQGCSRISTTA